jgi:hypothetical protein
MSLLPSGFSFTRGTEIAGPAGPTGPPGEASNTGATGPTGCQGYVGRPGPEGPEGPEGPTGPLGLHGPDGPTGCAGPEGPIGPEGPTGVTGCTGPTARGSLTYVETKLPSSVFSSLAPPFTFIGTCDSAISRGPDGAFPLAAPGFVVFKSDVHLPMVYGSGILKGVVN